MQELGLKPYPIDDIPGRLMGIDIGREAFELAVEHLRWETTTVDNPNGCETGPADAGTMVGTPCIRDVEMQGRDR